jgi:hypothetical protein
VLAIEDIALSVHHAGIDGWTLRLCHRRQGDEWSDSRPVVYTRLGTSELVDVIEAELERLLGL